MADRFIRTFTYDTQLIRGVAIILVIAVHSFSIAVYSDVSYARSIYIWINVISHCAVPLFVILSGFMLSLSSNNIKASHRQRKLVLFKMIPTYVLWSMIYYTLYSLNHGQPFDLADYSTQFLLLGNPLHLWFLLLLIQFYLLFPILYYIYSLIPHKKLFLFGVLILQTLISELLLKLSEDQSMRHRWFPFTDFMLYFFLGFFIKDHGEQVIKLVNTKAVKLFAMISLIVSGWVVTTAILNMNTLEMRPIESLFEFRVAFVLIVLAMFILIYDLTISLRRSDGVIRKVLSQFGLFAYQIYLVHVAMIGAVHFLLKDYIGLGTDFAIITTLALVIPSSFFTVRWLSSTPLARIIF